MTVKVLNTLGNPSIAKRKSSDFTGYNDDLDSLKQSGKAIVDFGDSTLGKATLLYLVPPVEYVSCFTIEWKMDEGCFVATEYI